MINFNRNHEEPLVRHAVNCYDRCMHRCMVSGLRDQAWLKMFVHVSTSAPLLGNPFPSQNNIEMKIISQQIRRTYDFFTASQNKFNSWKIRMQ
jgi:hypothetical protein